MVKFELSERFPFLSKPYNGTGLMDNNQLDQTAAKRLINTLKKGTTPLDLAIYLNVGNERWYSASEDFCSDIETDGDSMVRFIKGYYGDGKTHFLGILRTLALRRRWIVSYVTLENTPIHKFDALYAESVKNFYVPDSIPIVPWIPDGDRRGAAAILAAFFSKWYLEQNGSEAKSGLRDMAVLQAVKARTEKLIAKLGLHELMAKAVQGYVHAALTPKLQEMNNIAAWLEGQPVAFREHGLNRRIGPNLARDFLRSLAAIAKSSGIRGSLILLDEAERVMDQTPGVRKKSYGVIRDLLDNADNQGGMPASMIYIAATPDMFASEIGFAEYDALRSRLANSQRFAIPNLMDWRGVIVDLVKTPLPHDHLIQLAQKVRNIHGLARNWDPNPYLSDAVLQDVVTKIDTGAFQISKPRMLASLVATLLEIAEQNRSQNLATVLDSTFEHVLQIMSTKPKTERWE